MESKKSDIIYRGNSIISVETPTDYSHPVVVKEPSKQHLSQQSIRSLEKEYEMLSEQPPELLAELRHATMVLDRAAMAALVDRIKTHAPDTARSLQGLLDDFQIERIRELLGDVI